MNIQDDKGKVIAKVTAADPNDAHCDEGVWVEVKADDGTRPTICLVKLKPLPGSTTAPWYLGVYRDAKSSDVIGGCDLGVSFTEKEGPVLQVRRGDDVKIVNLFDLLSK